MIDPNPIDRSLKVLIRRAYPDLFRLAAAEIYLSTVRIGDSAINVREHRADQLFYVGDETDPDRWAIYLEYQLQPNPRVLGDWFYKTAALGQQLERPVILVVVYLTRGDRASFPEVYPLERGGLRNAFLFEAIRLWEYADEIRAGKYPGLAPLLVLCEDNPTVETLQRERELILGLDAPPDVRADLLAVAVTVGMRFFAPDFLQTFFREELEMLKEASFIHDLFADEFAEGRAKALTEGRAEGRAEEARNVLLRLLRKRVGELPDTIVSQIEQLDLDRCRELTDRVIEGQSIGDLGL